jgi:hypothetical protein
VIRSIEPAGLLRFQDILRNVTREHPHLVTSTTGRPTLRVLDLHPLTAHNHASGEALAVISFNCFAPSRGSGWRPPRRPRLENPSTKLGLPVALVLIGCPIAGLGLVLLWQLIAAVVAARLF